jgi:RNA polymerase sigma factor (sigma-70 family)
MCNILPSETIVKVSDSNGMREMMQANRHVAQEEQEMALLYRKHAPGLLTYVRMRMLLEEDAEDLVVEVFMAAIENAKFAALAEKEKSLWLWRVTRNKVIDAYRRAKTRQNVTLEHVAEGLFEDEMSSPEYTALRQEDYMDLYIHLQSLPPLQQQILRMRFGQDLSCREIATTLGKQENLVRVTLSRSLNLLRKIYRRRREEQERD